MSSFQVSSSELRRKAGELRNINSQFKSQVANLEMQEQLLASMWEGDSKVAFHTAFSNDQTQMNNFYNLVEQYSQVLENIANKYDLAENQNIQFANTRSY